MEFTHTSEFVHADGFTHINEKGEARMVDVSTKADTRREAVAEARVRMKPETLRAIENASMKKGDVFAVARVAGILAAKRTHELIPLCHPIPVDAVEVTLTGCPPDSVHIRARVACSYHTGVEMEALTAASVAALTVYDMCKAADRGMTVEQVRLLQKSGGKSGVYERECEREPEA